MRDYQNLTVCGAGSRGDWRAFARVFLEIGWHCSARPPLPVGISPASGEIDNRSILQTQQIGYQQKIAAQSDLPTCGGDVTK